MFMLERLALKKSVSEKERRKMGGGKSRDGSGDVGEIARSLILS